MVSIPRRRMDLFRERSAFTGAETFADGVFTSMYVIVEHFTCIIWEGHQAVPSVIVETVGTVSFLYRLCVKYHRINVRRSKEGS